MRSDQEIREYIEDLRDCPLLEEDPDFDLIDAAPIARLVMAGMIAVLQWVTNPPGQEGNVREFAKKWARVDLDNPDAIDDTEGS